MNATEFLDHIASKDLLDTELLEKLRRQALEGEKKWSPEQIVKFLVDQGYLTRFQAKTVLTEVLEERQPVEESLGFADSVEGLSIAEDNADDSAEVIDLEDANIENEPATPDAPADVAAESLATDVVDLSSFSSLNAPAGPLDPSALAPPGPAQGLTQHPAQEPESGGDDMLDQTHAPESLLDPEFDNTVWDSRLVIGSALIFGFLSIAAVVLYIVLANKSAQKQWENALAKYEGGSYQQALSSMESFAETFPTDDNADSAKAYVAMCKIHVQLTNIRKDSAGKVRDAILNGKEVPGFSAIARDELKVLLPRLAENYVEQAVRMPGVDDKQEFWDLTNDTLEIIDMPGALGTAKNEQAIKNRLADINERMSTVKRYIDRNGRLETVLKSIENLVEKGDTRSAFIERHDLLQTYPELESDERMQQSVLKISKAEQGLVRVSTGTRKSNNDAIEIPPEHKVIVATRNGQRISGVQGYSVAVLAGGSVYGIELGSGRVNWRRHVGLQTALTPIRVSDEGNADTILVDESRYELVRVDTLTGEQKWRLPIGSPMTQPKIYNGQLYCNIHQSTEPADGEDGSGGNSELTGVLLVVNVDSGHVERNIRYPMGTHVGPGFDDENGIIYQIGDHSNLYAIAADSGECVGVYYQGHGQDSIVVPAVFAVGYIILVENGVTRAEVSIVKHDGKGTFSQGQEKMPLSGLVTMNPRVFGRRLLVATNLGEIHVYDVDPNLSNPRGPVAIMASIPGAYTDPIREYSLAGEGVLYMAGRRLVKYQVQAQLGELKEEWIDENGDVYVAPIQRFGNIVVHVRQRQGTNAITVAGQTVDARNPSWQTDIGSASNVMLLPDGDQLAAVTSRAGVFAVEQGETPKEIFSETPAIQGSLGYSHAIRVIGEIVLQSLTGSHRLLVLDSLAAGSTSRAVELQDLTAAPHGAGVTFQDQILMSLADGKLAMFQIPSGNQGVVAYQPTLRAGEQINWSEPSLPADDSDSFVILRDRRTLLRIQIQGKPIPHLSAQATLEFEEPVYQTIASAAGSVYVIRRTPQNDIVVGLDYETLAEQSRQPVHGRVVWGPFRVGENVLVYTSASRLYCFGTSQELSWISDSEQIKPIGKGFSVDGHYLLVGANGTIWKVRAEDGATQSAVPLGQKITGMPVLFQGKIWVPTSKGGLRPVPLG